jgi:putative ABC transport system permease protein
MYGGSQDLNFKKIFKTKKCGKNIMRRLIENVRISFQSLITNKLRAFLTMLGIIIGVGSVVAIMSVGSGAQQSIIKSVQNIGSNLIIVTPGSNDQQKGFTQMLSSNKDKFSLKTDDIKALENNTSYIAGAASVILNSSVISYLDKSTTASTYASSEKAKDLYNIEIAAGKFFSSSDVANSTNVAVLGPTVIKNLFGNTDPLGKVIKIDGKNFTVIGTAKSRGSNQFGNDQDNAVSIPVTTAQHKLYGIDYVSMIIANAKSEKDMSKATEEVTAVLRRSHHIKANDPNDFTVQNQTQILNIVGTITNIFTIVLSSIAGISLLVGGIGIMNIMLVSVTERTREIGIRKAIGAKNKDILVQFLVESIVLSITGGALGIVFAVIVAQVLKTFTILSTNISGFSILLAFTFSTIVGLFFGIYPAMRAARLNPIEALRYE